jgi:hypothetical protein
MAFVLSLWPWPEVPSRGDDISGQPALVLVQRGH